MGTNHQIIHRLAKINYQYRRLMEEHDDIEQLLEELNTHPSVDRSELNTLKKMRLHIVDEMARIQREHV